MFSGGEVTLTNGDVSVEDGGAGFSPGESPVSESPPAAPLDTPIVLDTDTLPPEFIPADPSNLLSMVNHGSMVGAESEVEVEIIDNGGAMGVEPPTIDVMIGDGPVEMITPPMIPSDSSSPITNGFAGMYRSFMTTL